VLNKQEHRELHRAKLLWDADKVDDAWAIVQKLLLEHPFDAVTLQMGGHIYEKAGNMPVAYHLFRTATEQDSRDATGWLNFGRVAEELWRTSEAERAYAKALKYADRDETVRCTYGNLAALCIDNARYQEAEEWSRKCLARWPDDAQTLANLGFAQLGLKNWKEGWKNYRNILGTHSRTKMQYSGEPEWDGTPGKTVVLYGEQGIGDEISFASMVPDAIAHCKKVIIDCDVRLANLFQRSFPEARVYGTRKVKPYSEKPEKWLPEDREFDASLAIGQIGEYYRGDVSDCPGTPYLVPDPERVLMWKSLWATKQKPVIGIAWQGGIPKTGAHLRRWTLETLLPVLKSVDAHWVVLEYKPAGAELDVFRAKYPEIDIREYPHATLTKDYDDTAALVASLDHVFCIQTAVAHLGGALGIPTWVCVPPCSQWRYGAEGDTIPWYNSVRVIRQGKGWDFNKMGAELAAYHRRLPAAARDAA
jgi:tetratricopeptide (TPR) repeat protein